MFNGFSAIELLIKIVSAKLPAFEKLADDAQKEFCAMKAAQQSVQRTGGESGQQNLFSAGEVLPAKVTRQSTRR